jgi:hypothetical protein
MKRFVPSLLIATALAAGLTLAGCETATPYQPLGAHNAEASGGFSEQQLDATHWRVSFAGNELTSRDTVERYLLYRSAEVTLANGGAWFAATDRQTDKKVRTYVNPDPFYAGYGGYWGPRWGFYRRDFGWGYGRWGDPFWGRPGPVDVTQVSKYQASAEIVIGKGPKPDDQGAFDARSVIEHLGPTIQRPTGG